MSLAKVTQFDEGPELVTRIRGLLTQLLAQEALMPLERAQVGMVLGQMGDDRPGVGTISRPGQKNRPDLLWTAVIEPGDFIMGEGSDQLTHRLWHPFRIAVYPVTVAQFELFIQDEGYAREELWTKAGWKWREQQQRTRPEDHAAAIQTPNHPRAGVTWYEAVAFCNWLIATFSRKDLRLPGGWKVRLPSEAEWERAARHTDGRAFPWGNEEQGIEQRCNMSQTGLGHTSAVGLFPSGKAVCGAADMAGNVWEWTRSEYGSYPYGAKHGREKLGGDRARVLRGGSWNYRADFARCTYRSGVNPVGRGWLTGFRVVGVPIL
jgi:formylglycine-generating enzyme required for sulfatase activity